MTPIKAAIVSAIRKIGRPLSMDELLPLTFPHCKHVVDRITGKILYDRDNLYVHLQELIRESIIIQYVDQVRGVITYHLPGMSPVDPSITK